MTAVPAREQGVVLVRFVVNPDVCDPRESIVDVITYAVDVRTLRILAMGVHSLPRSSPGDAPSTPPGAPPDSPPAAPPVPPS